MRHCVLVHTCLCSWEAC